MSGHDGLPAERAALARALDEIAPGLARMAERLLEVLPDRGAQPADEQQTNQFLRALVALVHEGLEGETDEKRRFVFDTAVPALVAQGQRPLDLVESHVGFFTLMSHRLLEAVPPELRDAAALWLAGYFSGYVRDVAAAAMAASESP